MNNLRAKVVAYTQAVDSDIKDANELIAYIARVSNPDNQNNSLTAPKLIKYLQEHKHWSPFEHYHLTIEIECPKDIGVQFLRHRSIAPQEFSQRYTNVNHMGFTLRECRLQDVKNRQNSLENDNEALAQEWAEKQQKVIDLASEVYNWAIENSIAKEQARAVLPFGNTMSRLYFTGNIRSWLHYLAVRLDPTTQKEHRQLAGLIKDEVSKYFDLTGLFEDDNGEA